MKSTSAAAFEAHIEQHLLERSGYLARSADSFDPELAPIKDDLLGYIRDSRPKAWAKQTDIHGAKLEANLLAAFDKATAQDGILNVLQRGFKLYGATINPLPRSSVDIALDEVESGLAGNSHGRVLQSA
ncbi:MAG: hypothetical protein KUG77_18245 [Nannocystaceae bacterium]|nr:hypothetical protein [Nannocystaceae bacterium]